MPYATIADFNRLALPAHATQTVPEASIEEALEAASRMADSYFAKRYPVPLATWGADTIRAVVNIAAFEVMSLRGFQPGSGADEVIVRRYDDALKWCELVSRKIVEPTGVVEAAPEIAAPLSSSDEIVDWSWNTRGRGGNGGPMGGGCCGRGNGL